MRERLNSVQTHKYCSAFARLLQAWLWPLNAWRRTEWVELRKGVAYLFRYPGSCVDRFVP
jgi:hypothetical protein